MKKLSIKLLALMLVLTSFVGCDETPTTEDVTAQIQDIMETHSEVEEEETPTDEVEEETPTDEVEEEETLTDEVEEEEETPTDEVEEEEIPVDEVEEEETPVDEVEEEETPTYEVEEEKTPTDEVEEEETPIDEVEEEETPTDEVEEEETPIDEVEEEETPVDVVEEEETPVDVVEEEETPVDVVEVEETPVDVVEEEETPTYDVEEEETPADVVEEETVQEEVAEVVQPVVTTTSAVTPTTIPDSTAKAQVYATLMGNANSPTQMTVYGTPVPSSSYMYRNMLSSTEQQLYDQLYAGLIQAQTSVSHTSSLSHEVVFKVAEYVYNDHPELIWINLMACTSGEGLLTPTYNGLQYSTATYYDTMATILTNAKDLPTDADKIKYIHNYISYHTTFDINYVSANDSQTAYSCLVGKRTVCAGYARAFQHCMQLLGIPTTIVNGSTVSGLHLWNLVYTNGKYYNVDINWDDWSSDPNQFNYTYYMLSDAQLSATRGSHVRDAVSVALPSAY